MKKLKFGIAGFGKMGRIREQSISDSDEAVLLATYDVESSRSDDQAVLSCSSFEELLETDIDAVIISTYVSFSAEYVVRALNAGKHVFCEKPPAINSEQMLEVLRMEKKSGKILKYGFNHRFHYSVIEAKKMIDEGSLGKTLMDAWNLWEKQEVLITMTTGEITRIIQAGGYFLIKEFICWTCLDNFHWQRISVLDVRYLSSSFWNVECEDNAFVTLKSSESVLATLHSSATQWRHKFLFLKWLSKMDT